MKLLFIDSCHPALIKLLREDGHDCIEGYNLSRIKILSVIKDFEGIIIRSRILLDKEFFDKAENLRFIARAGAGMECIDLDCAKLRNIRCINSPEGNRDAVGEHAIAMLLALMNNLMRADKQIRKGEWSREENRGHEIGGKTIALIGYGNTGNSFASKLSGFKCKVIAFDKYLKNFGNNFVSESSMQEVFDEADVLSLHVPLTAETQFMVDDKFIRNFRKNIYLVNTARGKCVHSDALVKNLKSGKIIGACLDVNEYEDSSFEKFSLNAISNIESWKYLLSSDNVLLTPHIAGWSYESHEKIALVLVEKIRAFLAADC